jgi:nicotinamidase-related amidase
MLIELDYPIPLAVELEAAQTLLLVIDMENENAHPAGALYIGEPVRKIIPRIAQLRDQVRQAGGRVVHTQSVRSPDALELTVFKNTVRKLEGTWGAELIDELKPGAEEPLIVKHTHDCFYQTEMDALLKQMELRPGEGRVIVTGISTRNCVQSAVMGSASAITTSMCRWIARRIMMRNRCFKPFLYLRASATNITLR